MKIECLIELESDNEYEGETRRNGDTETWRSGDKEKEERRKGKLRKQRKLPKSKNYDHTGTDIYFDKNKYSLFYGWKRSKSDFGKCSYP